MVFLSWDPDEGVSVFQSTRFSERRSSRSLKALELTACFAQMENCVHKVMALPKRMREESVRLHILHGSLLTKKTVSQFKPL